LPIEGSPDPLPPLQRFVPHFVHALRNSLSSIKLSVQVIADAKGSAERSRKSLSLAAREIDRLERMLSMAVELVKPDGEANGAPPASIALDQILREASEAVRPELAARQIEWVLALPEAPLPTFPGSARRVRVAVEGLLAALGRAVPEHGRLEASVTSGPGELVLTVTDSGPPLSEPERRTLFVPLARSVRSSGMDLPLVGRIAQELGGSIEVCNREGGGVVFTWTFALPRELA
jgi:signal transduction histidine kinase